MKNEKIAVIGGGFAGLCVISNLIQRLKNKKKNVHITLFDPYNVADGIAYNKDLPSSFKINHEANYMGIVNPFSTNASYDDFYNWLQENKNKKLLMLNGDSIANKYKEFALHNPDAHLPRSLYGYYLKYRFEELLSNSQTEDYTFIYKKRLVTNITPQGSNFKISYEETDSLFSFVVLSTGDFFNYDENNIFYSSKPYQYLTDKRVKLSDEIGILGSSLSAVETAITLAERGYKKITLFSRNGRLPKIRGKIFPYTLQYINTNALTKLKGQSQFIEPTRLMKLLKKEFDFAYQKKKSGLYQKAGINWQEIMTNRHPLKQLDEDIKIAQSKNEMIWRSVLISLNNIEMDFWHSLSPLNFEKILKHYASFILCYFSPMPLVQAEKLQAYVKTGVIKLKSEITLYEHHADHWEICIKYKKKVFVDHLIDARGYSQDGSKNVLLTSLITSGFLEKHSVYGIRANKTFQIVNDGKTVTNVYAIGAMINGERPLKASTPYITQYAKTIASHIVNRL